MPTFAPSTRYGSGPRFASQRTNPSNDDFASRSRASLPIPASNAARSEALRLIAASCIFFPEGVDEAAPVASSTSADASNRQPGCRSKKRRVDSTSGVESVLTSSRIRRRSASPSSHRSASAYALSSTAYSASDISMPAFAISASASSAPSMSPFMQNACSAGANVRSLGVSLSSMSLLTTSSALRGSPLAASMRARAV